MSAAEQRLVLAARRERLLRLAAQQRGQLGLAGEPLRLAWLRVERGLVVWRRLRSHAWLLATPVALLALWRPRLLWRALAGAATLWRAGRTARHLLVRWAKAPPTRPKGRTQC